eukprot:CAMPEP_0175688006 /NCGR_PEP_ID=MMETSP0097-20121207/28662_1 /TAXON_ID=311494 /ORGANISM="Alexandrium monilatum, Strain CCMP3105" /LENGTH=192 /DNA_ID=CAMNT_0016995017 /DNA_START=107 /DNA_END=685 /DNA_ORIENTATION=+
MAEISSGWKRFVSPLNLTSIMGLPPSPRTTLNGQCFMSACTAGSSNFRPMRRLASKTVFEGFLAACPFAASPMSRSLSVKATNEGVVRLPSEFSMIWTPSRCQMPTQEKVVPKSMPMAGAFRFASLHGKAASVQRAADCCGEVPQAGGKPPTRCTRPPLRAMGQVWAAASTRSRWPQRRHLRKPVAWQAQQI